MFKRTVCLVLTFFLLAGACLGFAQETPAADSEWETVLLIGTDSRSDGDSRGRADAIMVGAIHRETGAIRLISLARDMWIELPGRSSHNKINTAYRIGGPEMMMEAVSDVTGLSIDRYAAIDFFSFCDLIDALGSITVTLEAGEAAEINRSVNEDYGSTDVNRLETGEGEATLNGAQALAYARIRRLDNDFGRTSRQRKVLMAVMQKVSDMAPTEILAFAMQCFECVETNLGLTDLIKLGTLALSGGMKDVDQLSLPAAGDYRYDDDDGTSKVVFNAEATLEKTKQFLTTQE